MMQCDLLLQSSIINKHRKQVVVTDILPKGESAGLSTLDRFLRGKSSQALEVCTHCSNHGY